MKNGEYHLSVSVWIMNEPGNFLISKRVPTKLHRICGKQREEALYPETCALIGMIFLQTACSVWKQRRQGPASIYTDIVELEMYYGSLAGLSLAGERYFMKIHWRFICLSTPDIQQPKEESICL